jgi:hypothetical protein
MVLQFALDLRSRLAGISPVSNFIPEFPSLLPGLQLYYLSTTVPRRKDCLFYGYTLGQIPRFIDVAATQHGNVIGQELQREHG